MLSNTDFVYHDWKNWQTDQKFGYILEVDLLYDEKKFEEHSDNPLAPEKFVITENLLSPIQLKRLFEAYNKQKCRSEKLTATFYPRKNYVLHYLTLKYYLENGLILDKVHNCIQFEQSTFALPFIQAMTEKRKLSNNQIEQNVFKLSSNCGYGKSGMHYALCTMDSKSGREPQMYEYTHGK